MGILSWKFRIVLFLGSVVVFLLIARFVRKQRIQVKDGIFWILFSVILIIFSIFPRLAIWASYLTGVQSPSCGARPSWHVCRSEEHTSELQSH